MKTACLRPRVVARASACSAGFIRRTERRPQEAVPFADVFENSAAQISRTLDEAFSARELDRTPTVREGTEPHAIRAINSPNSTAASDLFPRSSPGPIATASS